MGCLFNKVHHALDSDNQSTCSFDEGLASRVPYESAARTLTQKKNSFSGYVERACNLLFCYNAMLQALKHVHEY